MAEPLRQLFRHLNHFMNEILNVIIYFSFIFILFLYYAIQLRVHFLYIFQILHFIQLVLFR